MENQDPKVGKRLNWRKVNWRFVGVLVTVAVVVFVASDWIIGSIIHSIELRQLVIRPLDEGIIYDGLVYNLKDDISVLVKPHYSYLNGAPVAQSAGTEQPIAVVVENYTPIREQQAGIEQASLVYEALAEGGITRLLAIYDGASVDLIGPIRSARPYFVTWASELRAAFAHVGGSNEALGDLRSNFRILNVDEFADFKTIWRDNDYLAPHNAYSSTEKIQARMEKDEYKHPLTVARFPFKDADSTSGDIKTITIDFSLEPYAVKYVFDPIAKAYERFNGGKKHHEIKPTNVVIQFVDIEVLDDIGRLWIQTSGTGKALVFRDGTVIEGTWAKDCSINSNDQPLSSCFTKFFDKDDKEIALNRGQTWIEVVPNGRAVNYF